MFLTIPQSFPQEKYVIDKRVTQHKMVKKTPQNSPPHIEACPKALQPGNTFVVWKFDRLGRNLKHLVTTVDELHGYGVGLRVLAGEGTEIDRLRTAVWSSASSQHWPSSSAN